MSLSLILGDVHLGGSMSIGRVGIGSVLNSRLADQQHLLDWTLDYSIDKNISTIILTGDIFDDPKPNTVIITIFISWLKKCQANNISVHIILGNHDMIRSGSAFTSSLDIISEIDLDNVYIYKNINTIFVDTTAFTFMPFRDRKSFGTSSNSDALSILRDSLIYELESIPKTYTKIIVGHMAITGSIPVGNEIDDLANELFCPIDMFSGYDYVWMGHVHKPQIMKKNNPYIAHIGSMDVSNFGETDHKKHIVVIDNLSDKSFTTEYLPTRKLLKLAISIPQNIKNTTQYVINEIKKQKLDLSNAIIKVEITLLSPELQSISKIDIENYLIDNGAYNIAGILESKKLSSIKKNYNNIDTKMDVQSTIKIYSEKYVDKTMQEKFITLATNIYESFKYENKE